MSSLVTLSATRIAALIRAGDVTSREAVDAHIVLVRRVNPALNAMVCDRFDEARREADEADRQLSEADPLSLPPLHGVPCTIKENFAFTNMPNTAGLVARKGTRASADATTVARLRAAGAIPLGVTNISELCMWLESHNNVYGRTGNAYHPGHIAGGSSGGEGAIIGSGASPFGLGADFAGSIRLPAFFNGVFGHKPSGGLVPGTGQWPTSQGDGLRYVTTGPLCRRAEDLMPLLEILAGPDGEDEGCRAYELGDPAGVDLTTLRVIDLRGNGLSRVSHELTQAQARTAEHLRDLGAHVSSPSFPALRRSFEIWTALASEAEDVGRFRGLMRRRGMSDMLKHLALWSVGRSPHTFAALALGLAEDITERLPGLSSRAIERGATLRAALLDAMGDHGVILYPSFTCTAPPHKVPARRILKYSLASAYTSIFNVFEFPSTQVPLGLDTAGLPLGVQVVSRPGNDHVTIAVAMELERAFGGWTLPAASTHTKEQP